MNYLFFGSPRFAEIVLESLVAGGMRPRTVICNPDRPVGRKKILTAPPVKIFSKKNGIEVLQPETLKGQAETIESLRPDFCIVAAYAKIIPKEVLTVPSRGMIGAHPSL